MKDIWGLVEYVSPSRQKRMRFLGKSDKREDTYVDKLYDLIQNNKVKSDREASEQLFGNPTDSRYYRAKGKLRERLVNSVLLVDAGQRERGEYYAAFVTLRKETFVADVMWKEGYPGTAFTMYKRVLAKAIDMEFSEILVAILPEMRNFCVVYGKDLTAFREYGELFEKWSQVWMAEQDIRMIYDEILASYKKSQVANARVTDIIQQRLGPHQERFRGINTVTYTFYSYFVRMVNFSEQQNYAEVIRLAWEAIGKLSKSTYTPRSYLRWMLLQIIGSTLRFENFREGKRAALEYLSLADEGDATWFRGYQLYVYLCIQSREFATAVNIINRVFSHSRQKRLTESQQQRWFLLRAYLQWLISTGNADPGQEIMHRFRFGRFLNETPAFAKDKKGLNIPVLIIQGLWLIHQGNYAEARKRFSGLERYGSRHLRSVDGLRRTYYFIKLISQLPKADFHREAFKRKAARYLKALGDAPRPLDQQGLEAEIIPYEYFYEYIINTLDNKLH